MGIIVDNNNYYEVLGATVKYFAQCTIDFLGYHWHIFTMDVVKA